MSSTNSKKSGGLAANPLLTRTEPTQAIQPPARETTADTAEDTGMHVDMQTRPRVDTPTSKFTFYFTEEQLDRLDDLWGQLRRANRRGGQRLSKSHVVRVALDRLLADFDEHPERVMSELKQELNQ